MRENIKNNRRTGAKYEQIAADYLAGCGYEIIARNYRNRYGEIDILAGRSGMLIFVEVKYRSMEDCGDPLEAVDLKKQKRISRVALCYYAGHGYEENVPCRFDVIAVYADGKIKHVENAFNFI